MRIVIAHRSVILLGQLQRRLERLKIDVVCAATELTEVYDFAEHHEPDCVLLTTDIADCPEFELLATLFGIMGIGCVVLGTPKQAHLTNAALRASSAIRVLPSNVSDRDLTSSPGARRPPSASQSTGGNTRTGRACRPAQHDFDWLFDGRYRCLDANPAASAPGCPPDSHRPAHRWQFCVEPDQAA
jgi:hypothetical protein